ncbi:MAG: cytochrome b N-terminal domain-containing protein [Chloroflexi bacterium]|nr:cytochrome b N-terminal domain-containing protein [Chloroflexota bacterium]
MFRIETVTQNRVWQSIFRQGYPSTDENRAKVILNSLFFHIHPVRVRKHTLKVTYTYGLGLISFFLFGVLVVTGILLMFMYVPSVDRAYDDIQILQTSVTFGMLLRNLHRWAAHGMVLMVFLHMLRVFYTGGYKTPREFNWIIGVFLFLITLFLSFTGYLLPWDQLSYWAITVGTNIAGYVPMLGEKIRFFLLGAKEVGEPALLRFYVLHVIFLPTILTLLIAVHFWRIRKDGGLSAPSPKATPDPPMALNIPPNNGDARTIFPRDPRKTYGLMELVRGTSPMVEKGPEDTVTSWPNLLIWEVLIGLGVIVALLIWSLVLNAPLREIANPDVTENPAKAPWYFLNLQELLLHMNPTLAGVLVPGALVLALIILPYLDRDRADVGIWFASKIGKKMVLWSSIYTTVALIGLVLFDEYVRVRSLVSQPEILPGWIIPVGLMFILIAGLYLVIYRWRPTLREIFIAYFTGFVVTYLILTIIGTVFRGLGMHLTLPWQLPPGAFTL